MIVIAMSAVLLSSGRMKAQVQVTNGRKNFSRSEEKN
jgi:hypothetical protein